MQRPVEHRGTDEVGVGVLVRVVRVPLVAELGQDHEDPVGLLTGQLDVLVVGLALAPGHLDDLAAVPLLNLRLAVQHPGQGLLAQSPGLVLLGAGQVVTAVSVLGTVHGGLRPRNRRRGRAGEGDRRSRGQG